jgi:hypothetical protein
MIHRYLMICFFVLIRTIIVQAQTKPVLIPFHSFKENLWGYCDANKKMIIKPQFTEAGFFLQENKIYYAKGKLNGKNIIITEDGNYVEDNSSEEGVSRGRSIGMYLPFYMEFKAEKEDSTLKGFHYNKKTSTLLKSPLYGTFYRFFNNDSCAMVELKSTGKIGGIDRKGNIVIQFELDMIESVGRKEEFIMGKKYDRWGVISLAPGYKETVPFFYKKMQVVNRERTHLLVGENDVWHLIDINSKLLYPTEFYNASYGDGMISAAYQGYYGYMNTDGKPIIPFIYSKVENFGTAPAISGFAWVTNKDGIKFFIDQKGKEYYSQW